MIKRFGNYPKNGLELHSCWLEFNSRFKTHRDLRFGQFMYNEYINDSLPWPELFYEEDNMKAYKLCLKQIKKENR